MNVCVYVCVCVCVCVVAGRISSCGIGTALFIVACGIWFLDQGSPRGPYIGSTVSHWTTREVPQ